MRLWTGLYTPSRRNASSRHFLQQLFICSQSHGNEPISVWSCNLSSFRPSKAPVSFRPSKAPVTEVPCIFHFILTETFETNWLVRLQIDCVNIDMAFSGPGEASLFDLRCWAFGSCRPVFRRASCRSRSRQFVRSPCLSSADMFFFFHLSRRPRANCFWASSVSRVFSSRADDVLSR